MSENQAILVMSYQNYDANKYFTESTPVDIHPLDGSVMPEPYSSTFKKVPNPIPVNKWPKFVNDEWVLVDNFVGTIYWDENHVRRVVANYEEVVPPGSFLSDPGPRLVDVKEAAITGLTRSYTAALNSPVPFTTKDGVYSVYQHDQASMQALTTAVATFNAVGAVPDNYYWVSAENIRVSFTLSDLSDLCAALSRRNFELFTKLQDYKDAVRAATDVITAIAIVWED